MREQCFQSVQFATRKRYLLSENQKKTTLKQVSHSHRVRPHGRSLNNHRELIQHAFTDPLKLPSLKLLLFLKASSILDIQWSHHLSNIEWTLKDATGCSHECLCLLCFDVDVITQRNRWDGQKAGASGSFPLCANVILDWLYCRCTLDWRGGSIQRSFSALQVIIQTIVCRQSGSFSETESLVWKHAFLRGIDPAARDHTQGPSYYTWKYTWSAAETPVCLCFYLRFFQISSVYFCSLWCGPSPCHYCGDVSTEKISTIHVCTFLSNITCLTKKKIILNHCNHFKPGENNRFVVYRLKKTYCVFRRDMKWIFSVQNQRKNVIRHKVVTANWR